MWLVRCRYRAIPLDWWRRALAVDHLIVASSVKEDG
jgi:hypothetical protein